VQRPYDRSDATGFGSFDNSTCKKSCAFAKKATILSLAVNFPEAKIKVLASRFESNPTGQWVIAATDTLTV